MRKGFGEINFTWYNELYPSIEPVSIQQNKFKWETLTDILLEKIPIQDRPSLCCQLSTSERVNRIAAFSKVLKKRNQYNWFKKATPSHCLGWKVIEANQYSNLINGTGINSIVNLPLDNCLDKGDITVINQENINIPPFYIAPAQYSRVRKENFNYKNQLHTGLIEIAKILEKQIDPQFVISKTIESSLYKGYYRLFVKQRPSYKGYIILEGKHLDTKDMSSLITQKSLSLGTINNKKLTGFFGENNTSSIIEIMTSFYKKYFPDKVESWLDFCKTNLSSTITILSNSLKQSEIECYPNSISEMKHYLKNSTSIYHRVCLFFVLNPIGDKSYHDKNITTLQNHHIIRKSLVNDYPELLPKIDKPFNLIRISWFEHFFLHFLRFIEFREQKDYKALKFMHKFAVNVCDKINYDQDSKELDRLVVVFNLFEEIKTWIKTQSAQDKLNYDTGSRKRLINQQYPKIRAIYQNNMIWKNNLYKDLPDLFVPAGTVDYHTELVVLLRDHLDKYLSTNSHIKKPRNWNSNTNYTLSHCLGGYLRFKLKLNKKPHSMAFWGFYIDF